jgi:hypothetical protein
MTSIKLASIVLLTLHFAVRPIENRTSKRRPRGPSPTEAASDGILLWEAIPIQNVYLTLTNETTLSDLILLVLTTEGKSLLFYFHHDLQPVLNQYELLSYFKSDLPNK